MKREELIDEMKAVFAEIPYGIEHTLRVLANADEIMGKEGVTAKTAAVVTCAAILHDIGAVAALAKYGSMAGHYQEIEGPAVAKEILERASVADDIIERVVYIVGHHHTPTKIDHLDFQILWDADVLDSLEFDEKKRDARQLREDIEMSFQTRSGKDLARKHLGC